MAASRKKAKGKARKNAKLKNGGAGQNPASCLHGVDPSKTVMFQNFIHSFLGAYNSAIDSVQNMEQSFYIAQVTTKDKYANLWGNPDNLVWASSYFAYTATRAVLLGNMEQGRIDASFACYFEQYKAVEMDKSQGRIHAMKIVEMQNADEHTLLSFLKHRIPCSCLDQKYKQVKGITKMGICANHKCSKHERMVVRNAMMCCSRCHLSNYCSRGCQVEDWPKHKFFCNQAVAKAKSAAKEKV